MAEKKVDFKSMTKEQKINYIKEYYRYHILIGCGLLIWFSYLGYQTVTKPNIVFNMAILGTSSLDLNDLLNFQNELVNVVVSQPSAKDEAIMMVYPFDGAETKEEVLNFQYHEKLVVQMIAGEIDLLYLDETQLKWLVEQDVIYSLDDYLSSISVDTDQYVRHPNTDTVVGIKLNDTNQPALISCENHDRIIAIPKTARDVEASLKVLNWLAK